MKKSFAAALSAVLCICGLTSCGGQVRFDDKAVYKEEMLLTYRFYDFEAGYWFSTGMGPDIWSYEYDSAGNKCVYNISYSNDYNNAVYSYDYNKDGTYNFCEQNYNDGEAISRWYYNDKGHPVKYETSFPYPYTKEAVWEYEYDEQDRIVTRKVIDDRSECNDHYTYDEQGRLLSHRIFNEYYNNGTADSMIRRFEYDDNSVAVYLNCDSFEGSTDTAKYGEQLLYRKYYDNSGNLVKSVYNGGAFSESPFPKECVREFEYDNENRLIKETYDINNLFINNLFADRKTDPLVYEYEHTFENGVLIERSCTCNADYDESEEFLGVWSGILSTALKYDYGDNTDHSEFDYPNAPHKIFRTEYSYEEGKRTERSYVYNDSLALEEEYSPVMVLQTPWTDKSDPDDIDFGEYFKK